MVFVMMVHRLRDDTLREKDFRPVIQVDEEMMELSSLASKNLISRTLICRGEPTNKQTNKQTNDGTKAKPRRSRFVATSRKLEAKPAVVERALKVSRVNVSLIKIDGELKYFDSRFVGQRGPSSSIWTCGRSA
jgi:hypothetical protein